jgi:hypothetical protein
LADVIRIDATDRLPLRSAELIAADGAVTPSGPVEVSDSPAVATGQSIANNPWRTGIGDTIGGGTSALGSGLPAAAYRSRVRLLAMASTASIPLPDPPAYRADWQHYRIRLVFGVPPSEIETREIAAPEPPPPAAAPPTNDRPPPPPPSR